VHSAHTIPGISVRKVDSGEGSKGMTFTDDGLWIDDVSVPAGTSIKSAVSAFRADHGLSDGAWQIRALGTSGGSVTLWIGMPPYPTYRDPWTICDAPDAGSKVLALLEDLLEKRSLPSARQASAQLGSSL
jgi:hypothetical protein